MQRVKFFSGEVFHVQDMINSWLRTLVETIPSGEPGTHKMIPKLLDMQICAAGGTTGYVHVACTYVMVTP